MKRARLAKKLCMIAAAAAMAGCASKPDVLYHYGSYSESYYAYKQEMTPERLQAFEGAMEDAIRHAGESTSGRVPPGMYANLGYLYLKQGRSGEAVHAFEMEKTVYPESTRFMDRIIAKVKAAEGGGSGS